MALPRLALSQCRNRKLVQCPGARMSGLLVGDLHRAAAGEGAWAVFERGTLRFVGVARGERKSLELCCSCGADGNIDIVGFHHSIGCEAGDVL